MIVPRGEITQILRGQPGETVVHGDPPAVGDTHWIRPSPGSPPACDAQVVDVWKVQDGSHSVLLERVSPPALPPRQLVAELPPLRLTREQRARLFAGDQDRPLVFNTKPDCEPGDVYVLSWSRAGRIYDEGGNVSNVPRLPLLWIEVKAVVRRTDGWWTVRFEVEDHRTRRRLVRATPPAYDPELMRRDQTKPPDAEAIARAREESFYTANPGAAVDHLEAVDDSTLAVFTAQNQEEDSGRERQRRERWARMSLRERAAELERLAPVGGVDVSREMRTASKALDKALEKIERQERSAA